VPGVPLETRRAWGPKHDYCFTSTALASQLWLIYEDDAGEWQARAVADMADAGTIPPPATTWTLLSLMRLLRRSVISE